ncbi:hypothetical protein [Nocardia concava]|uniref:hypothetical protein n=1 Tax=Nocardia concava TaxID=257281 RepID=UPI0012F71C84|nr:hypothetical protein [Nocardia concava]
MSSAIPGADFVVDLHPEWVYRESETGDGGRDKQAFWIACDRLRWVTERAASSRMVTQCSAAEIAINHELAHRVTVQEPFELAVGGWVRLAPAAESELITSEYLSAIRAERKRQAQAVVRLDHLRTVFESKEHAWLWWIDQPSEKLEALSEDEFKMLVSNIDDARNEHRRAETLAAQDSFVRIIGDLFTDTEPDEREYVIRMFGKFLGAFEKPTLVDRLENLMAGSAPPEAENPDNGEPQG